MAESYHAHKPPSIQMRDRSDLNGPFIDHRRGALDRGLLRRPYGKIAVFQES